MTPEIDRLRADYDAKYALMRDAKDAANYALTALNSAVAEWAVADLVEREIKIGVTPVNGAEKPWRGDELRWKSGKFLVVQVSASDGRPSYRLAKIKNDGTASGAGNGIYGQIIAVRKAGEA